MKQCPSCHHSLQGHAGVPEVPFARFEQDVRCPECGFTMHAGERIVCGALIEGHLRAGNGVFLPPFLRLFTQLAIFGHLFALLCTVVLLVALGIVRTKFTTPLRLDGPDAAANYVVIAIMAVTTLGSIPLVVGYWRRWSRVNGQADAPRRIEVMTSLHGTPEGLEFRMRGTMFGGLRAGEKSPFGKVQYPYADIKTVQVERRRDAPNGDAIMRIEVVPAHSPAIRQGGLLPNSSWNQEVRLLRPRAGMQLSALFVRVPPSLCSEFAREVEGAIQPVAPTSD